MCLRIVVWAFALGFAGGFGGMMLAAELRPGDFRAPAFGLIGGAVVGAIVGAGSVALFGRRDPGD